jgi:hypothetical protein
VIEWLVKKQFEREIELMKSVICKRREEKKKLRKEKEKEIGRER